MESVEIIRKTKSTDTEVISKSLSVLLVFILKYNCNREVRPTEFLLEYQSVFSIQILKILKI